MNAYEQQVMSALPKRVRQIVAEEAENHGVAIYRIFSPSRRGPVVMARWAAMYRTKEGNPSLSAPQIGAMFGRDHTSVLSGWARYSEIANKPRLTNYDLTKRVINPSKIKGVSL
jgi:chromosomal replication initiation ATPase DnaA